MTTPAARRPPPWPQVVWGPYLAAGVLVQHRTEDGSTTATREGGAGAWVLAVDGEGARYDFIRGYGPPSFAAAHTDLVRIATAASSVLGPRLDVRCGVRDGRRRCGALLGSVVPSSAGAVWRPVLGESAAVTADPGQCLPGSLPMLLPAAPERWRHWCAVLYARCPAHGPWALADVDLLRRHRAAAREATSGKATSYYVDRVVAPPHAWGQLVKNPLYWTQEEGAEALSALCQALAGTWPPVGMAGVHRSKVEARMSVVADMLLAASGDERG